MLRLISLMILFFASSAIAAPFENWQIWLPDPVTPGAKKNEELMLFLVILLSAICVFVLLLMLYVCIRFRAKANPVPSKTSHNTLIEIIWTAIPVLILVVIAIPSFKLMFFLDKTENPEMTIKAVAHQWKWQYIYPDVYENGDMMTFMSNMLKDDELPEGGRRLLEVDNRLVVPADTNIKVLVTSNDVIHSFYLPAFAVQTYAIKGRLNETWFNVDTPGVYSGQCNQICGVWHGFMPIVVEVLPKDEYQAWLENARNKFDRIEVSNTEGE